MRRSWDEAKGVATVRYDSYGNLCAFNDGWIITRTLSYTTRDLQPARADGVREG